MNILPLIFAPDDDGTGELTARVESNGFSGIGTAWFDLDTLRKFCAGLGDYPIDPAHAPDLKGGHWRSGSPATLERTLLSISISPHGGRGDLLVGVDLSTAVDGVGYADHRQTVSARFLVHYADLQRFQTAFSTMLDDENFEATLEASPS